MSGIRIRRGRSMFLLKCQDEDMGNPPFICFASGKHSGFSAQTASHGG
jgi:hypothetical protein